MFTDFKTNIFIFFYNREADEIDSEILELTKEVSRFVFPGPAAGKPSPETILTGFKDIVSQSSMQSEQSLQGKLLRK
jgi:hypothetical protein